MSKLILSLGTAVRLKNPQTCWQKQGGTIVDIWPDYEKPENSIVGIIFPRGGFVREEVAVRAGELLPFNIKD